MERKNLVTTAASAKDINLGRDGWLFLVGGGSNVLDYYVKEEGFPDATVARWTDLLAARRERCRALGVTYAHMIAPDKLTVYHDKFDGELPYRLRTPAYAIPQAARAAGIADSIVDILPYFMSQKATYKLFWQTDTHWTFEGCFSAYQMLCSQLGIEPNSDILDGKVSTASLILDLGAKLDPPVREEFQIRSFISNARRVAVNGIVAFKERMSRQNDIRLHVGSNVVFCNHRPTAADKVVVLFGDSYAEYRTHLLTGMLAETFRELHFVWSMSLDWSYIERVKPDIVITESAERLAGLVPKDDFDLERYTVRRLAPLMDECQ